MSYLEVENIDLLNINEKGISSILDHKGLMATP